jgi:hypothetical protein
MDSTTTRDGGQSWKPAWLTEWEEQLEAGKATAKKRRVAQAIDYGMAARPLLRGEWDGLVGLPTNAGPEQLVEHYVAWRTQDLSDPALRARVAEVARAVALDAIAFARRHFGGGSQCH